MQCTLPTQEKSFTSRKDGSLLTTVAENTVPGAAKKASFYINRNYAFLWSGQAISLLGDFIFNTTLTLWIATTLPKGNPGHHL